MARTKAEEKVITEKSSKKKNLVSNYLFQFFEKNHIKKSFEDRAQKQLQTTMNEPGNTYFSYLDTGKVIHKKYFLGSDYISNREKGCIKNRGHNNPEKLTLPEGLIARNKMEQNPDRCTHRTVENYPNKSTE